MIVKCHLREIRGKKPIRDVAEVCGIHRGTLSQLERGRLLPSEEQIPALERAYGQPVHKWYPPFVLAAVTRETEDEAA